LAVVLFFLGISSGVFCVIFGIYEKLVNSVLNLFQDFKKNLVFLFPIVLGGITGIFLVGKTLNFLFANSPMPTSFCFIGLICGSLPILFKQANQKKGFRLHYSIFLLAAFGIGLLSIQLETILPSLIQVDITNISFFYFVLAGFAMSIGIVVPGVSSTIILMCLGVYSHYLNAVATANPTILFPMGIGVLLGSILFLKMIQFLLDKYYSQTFYAIIGFVLGSIFVLYPGIEFTSQGILSILLFIISFCIGLAFEKLDTSR
jgi:putative membrane protein